MGGRASTERLGSRRRARARTAGSRRPIERVDDRPRNSVTAGVDVLRAVRVALWGEGDDRGRRDVRRPATRSVPSHRPRVVREGQGGTADRRACRPAAASAQAHEPQGRRRSGLAAHRMGRGARHRRRAAGLARARPRPRVGGLRHRVALHVGDVGFDRLGDAPAARVRQPEPGDVHGAVRLGALPGVDVHLRRRGARRVHARSRARRVHPVLGLQPVGGAPRARDEHGRRAAPRGAPGRGRSAPGGPGARRRSLAAGAPGHGWRAGAGAGARDDRARLVRRGLRSPLDRRPAARPRRHAPLPARRGAAAGGRSRALRRLGRRRPGGRSPTTRLAAGTRPTRRAWRSRVPAR